MHDTTSPERMTTLRICVELDRAKKSADPKAALHIERLTQELTLRTRLIQDASLAKRK